MSVNPQPIDRQKVLRAEKEKRFIQHLLRHAIAMLEEGERLGEPYRDGNRLILPIMKPEEHGGQHDVDPVSLHALMEAWLDDTSE